VYLLVKKNFDIHRNVYTEFSWSDVKLAWSSWKSAALISCFIPGGGDLNLLSKTHSLFEGVNEFLSLCRTCIVRFEDRCAISAHNAVRRLWVTRKSSQGRPYAFVASSFDAFKVKVAQVKSCTVSRSRTKWSVHCAVRATSFRRNSG
jgi:hypothetical protein